jgi:hypothetical protein
MIAEILNIVNISNRSATIVPSVEEITINTGDTVYVYDDETSTFAWATFVAPYETLRGESSPYFAESLNNVHRAFVREIIINLDGSIIERPNYILLENIWHESEVNAYPFTS